MCRDIQKKIKDVTNLSELLEFPGNNLHKVIAKLSSNTIQLISFEQASGMRHQKFSSNVSDQKFLEYLLDKHGLKTNEDF
ncbi:hypothetical protein PHSC3_000587 [Chlamydiales bacterium STE3]|nr:hypothetical protein PHSC3_000587 [Chlamydiales bacterium STE3]